MHYPLHKQLLIKKGRHIEILDLEGISMLGDYFMIVSAKQYLSNLKVLLIKLKMLQLNKV